MAQKGPGRPRKTKTPLVAARAARFSADELERITTATSVLNISDAEFVRLATLELLDQTVPGGIIDITELLKVEKKIRVNTTE